MYVVLSRYHICDGDFILTTNSLLLSAPPLEMLMDDPKLAFWIGNIVQLPSVLSIAYATPVMIKNVEVNSV